MAEESIAKLKLHEIALRIRSHIHRFEKDPSINQRHEDGLTPYYNSGAHASGSRIFVTYISFQGGCSLTKRQAVAYLKGLDGGFIGRHFEFERPPARTPVQEVGRG